VDPATRHAPYDIYSQSHDPSHAPSYFAKKSNLVNQLFVKRGWFWVTLSFLLFLLTHRSFGTPAQHSTRKRVQAALRWGLATLYWVFITQWFFGPAVIDRSFLLTGGACEIKQAAEMGADIHPAKELVSGVACKARGGRWAGGHDISGHVFLLVLGSMFLFEEVLYGVLRAARQREREAAGLGADDESRAESVSGWDWAAKFALGVGALSLWMLLMTAAYFHTWFEKVCLVIVQVTSGAVLIVCSLRAFLSHSPAFLSSTSSRGYCQVGEQSSVCQAYNPVVYDTSII
jgi:hypothetical protein